MSIYAAQAQGLQDRMRLDEQDSLRDRAMDQAIFMEGQKRRLNPQRAAPMVQPELPPPPNNIGLTGYVPPEHDFGKLFQNMQASPSYKAPGGPDDYVMPKGGKDEGFDDLIKGISHGMSEQEAVKSFNAKGNMKIFGAKRNADGSMTITHQNGVETVVDSLIVRHVSGLKESDLIKREEDAAKVGVAKIKAEQKAKAAEEKAVATTAKAEARAMRPINEAQGLTQFAKYYDVTPIVRSTKDGVSESSGSITPRQQKGIIAALMAGRPYKQIAQDFDLTPTSLASEKEVAAAKKAKNEATAMWDYVPWSGKAEKVKQATAGLETAQQKFEAEQAARQAEVEQAFEPEGLIPKPDEPVPTATKPITEAQTSPSLSAEAPQAVIPGVAVQKQGQGMMKKGNQTVEYRGVIIQPEKRAKMSKTEFVAAFKDKRGRDPSETELQRATGKYWIPD